MPDVKCRHCGAAFSNANALKVHIREEHRENPYKEPIYSR